MSLERAGGTSDEVYESSLVPEPGQAVEDARATPLADEGLLQAFLETEPSAAGPARSRLDTFLHAATVGDALRAWFGSIEDLPKRELAELLNRHVARIDQLLSAQLNPILHHPRFQRLEAIWRGLYRLIDRVDEEDAEDIKIKALSVSWRELERDFERAVDFDQSALFKKVYENEFGMPGGEPFGVLIGDYEVSASQRDVNVLSEISGVAAAAFCPFIAAAGPAMFGLDNFAGLEGSPNLARGFQELDFLKWRAFRDTEDSRFVGLTLPRVLMRVPYGESNARIDRFRFREDAEGADRSRYLWGNAAFAFAEVLIRSYAESGWLAGIRGVARGIDGGGLLSGLPVHSFSTDATGIAPKCSTDVIITDAQEKELAELGFIPLCHCHDTEYSAFYSNSSVQKPKKYDRQEATRNARISSMLQYVFCASRFAHYVKAIVRDKVGSALEPEDCQRLIENWIVDYVTPDADASREIKARQPLRKAQIEVRRNPSDPGKYGCSMNLWPHFELDELVATMRLATELGPELRR